jgi:hypothetical protein
MAQVLPLHLAAEHEQQAHLRVITPTRVDLPLSTLPMMATRTSSGWAMPLRRRTTTSAASYGPCLEAAGFRSRAVAPTRPDEPCTP